MATPAPVFFFWHTNPATEDVKLMGAHGSPINTIE